ncbi:MAG: NeuD/PglB/VioB family sugar acetyltransferase [Ignavibacteria bacterium]
MKIIEANPDDFLKKFQNKVLLVGAFHEIIELAEDNGMEIAGMIDNEKTGNYRKYKIICNDKDAPNLSDIYKNIPLLITPDVPMIRKKLHKYYRESGFIFSSLVSKDSMISKSAVIGTGTIIQSGVNVSAESKIGKFVKLNTKCNIMHDSTIGDYSTIAPNAVLLGNTNVGDLCYIGSNATILPNVCICDNVIIGAGAVVNKDIDISGTYAGVPAKLLKSA